MGFPINDHVGVIWGYHHLRKHPYEEEMMSSLLWFHLFELDELLNFFSVKEFDETSRKNFTGDAPPEN